MRLRKRAVGLILGAGLLFFLGTNVQAGWLLVLSASLLGAVVAGILLPFAMLRGVSLRRRLPGEMHQNEEAVVEVAVSNASRGMRLGLSLADPMLSPARMFVPTLAPGMTVEIETSRRAESRGLFEDAEVLVSTDAPFGVAERRKRVRVGGGTLVLPAIFPLGKLDFIEPSPAMSPAIHTAPRRGQGPEYFGIREYRTGDSMRHVHWPSTARTGTVMVREFEQESTRRLAIAVDSSYDSGSTWTPLDRCCSAAASIAMAASARGHGTRLVLANDAHVEVLARTDPGEMLRRLAQLRTDPLLTFEVMLEGLAQRLRGAETIVLVFPSWRRNDPVALAPRVGQLAASFARVVTLVVGVDPEEGHGAGASGDGLRRLMSELQRAGADVRYWPKADRLEDALSSARVGATG